MSLKRYALYLIACSLAALALVLALEAVFSVTVPSSATSLIAVFVVGQIGGQQFAREHKRLPEQAERRAFAKVAVIVNALLGAALVVAFLVLSPELKAIFADPTALAILFMLLALLMLVVYFVSGQFFKMGAKAQVMALEKQAEKQAQKSGKQGKS